MNKWENFNFEEAVKKVFGNKHGQELIEFLVDAYVFRASFVQGQVDSTAFREGEKNVVLTLKHLFDKKGDK